MLVSLGYLTVRTKGIENTISHPKKYVSATLWQKGSNFLKVVTFSFHHSLMTASETGVCPPHCVLGKILELFLHLELLLNLCVAHRAVAIFLSRAPDIIIYRINN